MANVAVTGFALRLTTWLGCLRVRAAKLIFIGQGCFRPDVSRRKGDYVCESRESTGPAFVGGTGVREGRVKAEPEGEVPAKKSPSPWVRLLLFTVEQSRAVPGLHPADRDDAAQEALIGYHSACRRGDHIDNPEAWLKAALRRQAGKRARARRQRKAMSADGNEDLENVPASALPVQETTIEALRVAMPLPEAAWFEDILSLKTDRQLAERHGITEAAIRKRRERVDCWLQCFLEVRGHKRHSRGT